MRSTLSPTTVSWWRLSLANDAWGWDTMDICLHLWHPSMVSWWALLSGFQTTRDATKCSQITLHKSIPVSLVQPLCSGLLLQQAGCHWPMMHEAEIQWSRECQLSIEATHLMPKHTYFYLHYLNQCTLYLITITQKPPFPVWAKLWNQVPSLDHFVIQNSGDYLFWKYR